MRISGLWLQAGRIMDEDFEPLLGRIRSAGSRRARNYLNSVIAAAVRAGVSPRRPGRSFTGSRLGRGGAMARVLTRADRYSGLRSRRAIVKTRLVRLGGRALAAAHAHLKYIQRDGVTREGEPGRLYSTADDVADGKTFLERCGGDRHQFRLIVSAEDGALYDDLRPLVRRFMARMEQDLGTSLDWVAADHVDTPHPHSHIMLRGKDELGENLVIAPDYIRHGMRARLAELVSIDLGPRTAFEIVRHLELEVDSERLTSIDRRLLREAGEQRTVAAAGRDMADHKIRIGRLRKLAALGLADKLANGRWRLGNELEATLRRMGEQGDIIRIMQRALKAGGVERPSAERNIFAPGHGAGITGRTVERGLAEELRDCHYLLIDGIDGRFHYVDLGQGDGVEPLPDGSIVRISPRVAGARETDRRIAALAAANGRRYSAGLEISAGGSAAFAETHVRRLEAIRNELGGVERLGDGSWSVPDDFIELAGRYEAARARRRPVEVETLSPLPLERLADHDGATWLDRELIEQQAAPRDSGFGRELRRALAARSNWLMAQGLAEAAEGAIEYRSDLLAILRQREVIRVAGTIARDTGLEFAAAEPGSTVEGLVRRRLDLASGRFAMIESGLQFSLVPWRPSLERAIGKRVVGTVGASGGISWAIGRERGIGV